MINIERHKKEHITKPYDESGDTNEALLDPFMRGKIRMENAINEFIKTQNPEFSVITINPGFLVGRSVTGNVSSSLEMIKMIMTYKFPSAPRF